MTLTLEPHQLTKTNLVLWDNGSLEALTLMKPKAA